MIIELSYLITYLSPLVTYYKYWTLTYVLTAPPPLIKPCTVIKAE